MAAVRALSVRPLTAYFSSADPILFIFTLGGFIALQSAIYLRAVLALFYKTNLGVALLFEY